MTIVVLGLIPWREAAQLRTIASEFIVRTFADPATGRIAGTVMTGLILFVAAASLYATILGYSRIPFAAARDGDFFAVFARVHPDQTLPPRLAGGDHADLVAVLLLHARPAGELADSGADPPPLHLAVRGGHPAPALPPRHSRNRSRCGCTRCRPCYRWRCGSTSSSPARARASSSRSRSLPSRWPLTLSLSDREGGLRDRTRQGLDPCGPSGSRGDRPASQPRGALNIGLWIWAVRPDRASDQQQPAMRSASAAIVCDGLRPIGVGTIAPPTT